MPHAERLDEVLTLQGFTTNRSVRRLLQSRNVTVNGVRVTIPSSPFVRGKDILCVDEKTVPTPPNLYIMLNKAQDRVCTHTAGHHASVFDSFPEEIRRPPLLPVLHSIGRLDLDTEGLLILTTDGRLSHRMTTPEFRIPKTYLVYLRDELTDEEKAQYELEVNKGIFIKEYRKTRAFVSAPAKIEWVSHDNPYCTLVSSDGTREGLNTVCLLTLTEGKFHEVKRIFYALGNEVMFLKRVAFGSLTLDTALLPGQWRFLTDSEVCELFV